MRSGWLDGLLAPVRGQLFWILLALSATGCAGASHAHPSEPAGSTWTPLDYANNANWLCRPGLERDVCRSADLDATSVLPDGSTRVVHGPAPAPSPSYDCFYLYPTAAFDFRVGNVSAASLRGRAVDPVLAQAARFRGQCRLFVPLYRQITITTYLGVHDVRPYLERAYADVQAAFRYYLAHEGRGRRFVILAHSQGAQLGRQLVQQVIAPDPALRRRLIAAVLVGGDVLTSPDGATVNTGGVPLCTPQRQPGCIIAYRTYREGHPPPGGLAPTVPGKVPAGQVPACVDPAVLDGRDGRFAASYFPTSAKQLPYDPWQNRPPLTKTPFILYRSFYASRCAKDSAGFPYLAVRAAPKPGDVRKDRLPYRNDIYRSGLLGLHILDYDFALGDLMTDVNQLAAAKAKSP